jgi:TrmH family RNA methyltransferase
MQRIQTVTSAANPLVRDVRRAVARGGLTAEGLCVAEGFHLLAEAQRSKLDVPVVIVAASGADRVESGGARTVVLADSLFQEISSTETSQGVIALIRPPEWKINDLFDQRSLVVVLDGIQDPGNAGTIVRAAEAFGASGVMFLKGTVSPWNPKTLRASAGSLFRVPHVTGIEAQAALAAVEKHHVSLYAAMPFTGEQQTASSANLGRACAVVIGSEGRGVSDELRTAAAGLAIPTLAVESLNAAIAASVVLYEAHRQRTRQ